MNLIFSTKTQKTWKLTNFIEARVFLTWFQIIFRLVLPFMIHHPRISNRFQCRAEVRQTLIQFAMYITLFPRVSNKQHQINSRVHPIIQTQMLMLMKPQDLRNIPVRYTSPSFRNIGYPKWFPDRAFEDLPSFPPRAARIHHQWKIFQTKDEQNSLQWIKQIGESCWSTKAIYKFLDYKNITNSVVFTTRKSSWCLSH